MDKYEIIIELVAVHNRFWDTVEKMPLTIQSLSINNKWTPVQNVEHINMCIEPLVRYLNTPKELIKEKFGLKSEVGFEFKDLNEKYIQAVQNGAVISETFKPKDNSPSFKNERMRGNELINKINSLLEMWSDDELSAHICPHPVLGRISVREMLYFTIFHCETHIKIISRVYLA
jgi:hypothetical protein